MSGDIQRVHVIFKTHLDIGFTDYARNVTRQYFDDFIPNAIRLARRLRHTNERFVWTTGSWLIYEYLEKASAPQRKALEDAIVAGDIVWHGLPFTAHSELMDASLFRYALSLSQKLDARFGRKTIAAKMTDVPGHTRGIVPLLAEAGIQFLHIGVNFASTLPSVPPVFVWRDEASGSDVIVMYHPNYGDVTTIPGLSDAISVNLTNDNLGPSSDSGVLEIYNSLRTMFPGAKIFASTLDAYAAQLVTVKSQLPVLTAEIGDTWIHGVGTDPTKVSQFRELSRLRKGWVASNADDENLGAFSRSLMMVAEHTWGMDEKTHLVDYTHYDAEDFQAARKLPNFQKFEASWAEQREYISDALAALGNTPIADAANMHLSVITPAIPDKTGYIACSDFSFDTAHFSGEFNPQNGSIIRLMSKQTGCECADSEHALGLFKHELFSAADYQRFYTQYIRNKEATREWSVDDFTKPGLETPEYQSWLSTFKGLYQRIDETGQTFLLEMTLPDESSPRQVYLEITFPNDEAKIEFDLQWFDKPANRVPEALWFSFNPIVSDAEGWQMNKMGTLISPLTVVENGNRSLHAVENVRCYHGDHVEVTLESLDAPLVAPGTPSMLNFNNDQPPLENGMHFNLYNNIWGTNFPMWFEDDARFRFVVRMNG
jgi:Domain of unknown function (DUF5054)